MLLGRERKNHEANAETVAATIAADRWCAAASCSWRLSFTRELGLVIRPSTNGAASAIRRSSASAGASSSSIW